IREAWLKEGESIDPYAVQRVLTEIGKSAIIYVILDEFDKSPKGAARAMTADTIKLFSDRNVPATIIIVGVADDVHGLIEDHKSIGRCLMQVHMPRMSIEELEQIIVRGLSDVHMSIAPEALVEIIGLSKGLPHYTHLLGLHSGRQALDSQSLRIE